MHFRSPETILIYQTPLFMQERDAHAPTHGLLHIIRTYVVLILFLTPLRRLSPYSQRTDIPDLFVNILAAMFIEASSWKSNFAAYGMWICEILVLFLQGLHSND